MSSESRFGAAPTEPAPCPGLYLLPLDDSFYPPKRIPLFPGRVRIGRQLNQRTAPAEGNGVFESRVLSRQHAEAWVEGDRILIRDVKSSNGTFVNGERLSAENQESEPYELRSDDILEFGIDIIGEQGEVVHRKVAARVTCALTPADTQRAIRAEQRVYPHTHPTHLQSSAPAPAPSGAPHPADGPLPPAAGPTSAPVQGLFVDPSPAGGPAFAPRRPSQPHTSGLTGMGGMGAEPIRPKSVDFDWILTRLRDGPRSAAASGSGGRQGQAERTGPAAAPAAPRGGEHGGVIMKDAGRREHEGGAGAGDESKAAEAEAVRTLRLHLAETQAALARLPVFALPPPASASASRTDDERVPDSSGDAPPTAQEVAEGERVGGGGAESQLHANAQALREALEALREEVGEHHRDRDRAQQRQRQRRLTLRRRDRAGTVRAAAQQQHSGMGKGKAKEVQLVLRDRDDDGEELARLVGGNAREFWEREDEDGEGGADLGEWISDLEIERFIEVEEPEDRTPHVGFAIPAFAYGGLSSATRPDAFVGASDTKDVQTTTSSAAARVCGLPTPAALCEQVETLDKQLAALHERLGALQATSGSADEGGETLSQFDALSALMGRVDRLEEQVREAGARQQRAASRSSSDDPARERQKELERERAREELKQSLRAGLAAVQAEFRAFRTETQALSALPLPAPTPYGYTPLRLGKDDGVYVPDSDAAWEEGESSSDGFGSSEEEAGRADRVGENDSDRGEVSAHAHSREGSGESAPVPGRWRWGLLTPAGSLASRGTSASASGAALRPDVNERDQRTPGMVSSKGNVTEESPSAQTVAPEEPNAILLAGAVGVGAMLVAAAWWGS